MGGCWCWYGWVGVHVCACVPLCSVALEQPRALPYRIELCIILSLFSSHAFLLCVPFSFPSFSVHLPILSFDDIPPPFAPSLPSLNAALQNIRARDDVFIFGPQHCHKNINLRLAMTQPMCQPCLMKFVVSG